MANERSRKDQDRENLRNIITQWNANRLDLFELSEPNEDLEFHGVMRFYFQDDGQKVATKCIRVASTGSTKDVIMTLIEKFRPDMRMLSAPQYALYEIHENGEERQLAAEEKPLLVQLNWHKDDREGRFLLRRMDQKTRLPSMDKESSHFKRKLSKREMKEKKKKEKKERLKENENGDKIAEKLYTELPETSFTRSISNPEAVMRRRRQQKLEKKLQQFRNQEDAVGGTLKIFGESLCQDVPYRTLLLSLKDTAAHVVREILEKYGLEKEDPMQYCLVQHIVPHPIQGSLTGSMKDYHNISAGPKEYILDDDDCPLSIDSNFPKSKGVLTFHVRLRPPDHQPRKRKKKPKQTKGEIDQPYRYDELTDQLPLLLELNPDGSEITNGVPKRHCLHLNVTEVGCERSHASGTGQYLQLFGPNVQPRHCVLAHTEGIVTVTPSSRDAETFVNGMRIYETTILQHGIVVRFGKIHNFRFIDPLFEEKRGRSPDSRQMNDSFYDRSSMKDDQLSIHSSIHAGVGNAAPTNFETTFDVDGNVETISTHSSQMIQPKSTEADRMSRKSDDLSRCSVRIDGKGRGCDPILPAVLEFKEEGEDMFLSAVIPQADTVHTQFKLAPTYTLYMAARYRASTHYRPETSPNERAHRLTSIMNKVSALIQLVVQESQNDASSLAFWMANSSELLHFLKQDRHLSAYTIDAQDVLAESVQVAFRSLVNCLQQALQHALPAFLEDREDVNEEEGTAAELLQVLASAMALLRRCRVNAALTIQLFSQLFHFVNMWLFNKIVCDSSRFNYCTRLWGVRLKRRLTRIEIWAEKQGLELAADCHLSRIVQAAHLLQAPKDNPEDISNISSACFKLNSLQLKALLEMYESVADEPPIPRDLLTNVIKVAENTADELTKSDGREVKLEEDHELQLPFLLPEDGYSCDIVRGVPAGLQEFLYPLMNAGLCRMAVQPTSSGFWTIYMSDQDIGRAVGAHSPSVQSHRGDGDSGAPANSKMSDSLPKEPEVVTIKLKKSNSGMGLSIVAAKGAGQDKLGIYIKSVVKGGAADVDGRLQAGDQLLKVDGHSLVGISQEKAAEYMTHTGSLVTLEVARQGAIYHGLATLLNQPSPLMHRGSGHPGPRRMSERNLNQQHPEERINNGRIQSSKSVPTLNSTDVDENGRILSDGNLNKMGAVANQRLQPSDNYNPGYSRTSSITSIPKSLISGDPGYDGQVRSRSVASLRPPDGQHAPPHHAPMTAGPPPYSEIEPTSKASQRSLPVTPQQQEERHYQNLSQYQQQPPSSPSRTGMRPPNEDMYRGPMQPVGMSHHQQQRMNPSIPAPGQQIPPMMMHHHHQPPSPANVASRPVSTLISQRERDQYSLKHGQVDPRTSQAVGVQHQPGPQNVKFGSSPDVGNQPQRGADPPTWNHPRNGPPGYDPSKHRDTIRQEAKMEEMHEEVNRREERMRQEWNGQPAATRNQHPQELYDQRYNRYPSNRPPPPMEMGYHPQRPPPPGGMRPPNVAMSPADHERLRLHNQMYRESPPPPPPPTTTHPLMQQRYPDQDMHQQMPPRSQPPYHGPIAVPTRIPPVPDKSGTLPGISPWEREEREKMQQKKVEEARNLRDREINHLENIEYLTEKQEIRLRTLRLEKEFQRRAEEINQDEDDDDDEEFKNDHSKLTDNSRQSDLCLNMNDMMVQIERAKQQSNMFHNMSPQQEWLIRKQQEKQRRDHHGPQYESEDKNRKIEEVSRKKEQEMAALRELEAARDAEQKLLQEARRRQVEESRNRHNQRDSMQQNYYSQQQPMSQQPMSQQPMSQQPMSQQPMSQQPIPQQPIPQQPIPQQPMSQPQHIRNNANQRLQYSQPPLPHEPPASNPPTSQFEPSRPPLPKQIRQPQMQQYVQHVNPASTHYQPVYHPQKQNRIVETTFGGHSEIQSHVVTSHQQNSAMPIGELSSSPTSTPSGAQRLDSLLMMTTTTSQQSTKSNIHPPQPPERKSSYEITAELSPNSTANNSQNSVKKVSFNDSGADTSIKYDSNGNQENYKDSNSSDDVPSTPTNSLGSSSNLIVGSTPGVIGAQEVYRDPRKQIQEQRNSSKVNSRIQGPEKLSFKDKMKMFALETGHPETPQDKVKISRAQRDIETTVNGEM